MLGLPSGLVIEIHPSPEHHLASMKGYNIHQLGITWKLPRTDLLWKDQLSIPVTSHGLLKTFLPVCGCFSVPLSSILRNWSCSLLKKMCSNIKVENSEIHIDKLYKKEKTEKYLEGSAKRRSGRNLQISFFHPSSHWNDWETFLVHVNANL